MLPSGDDDMHDIIDQDSDGDRLPGFSRSHRNHLARTRAWRLMNNMRICAAYFKIMGTEMLAGNMPREAWMIDRSNDLYMDMLEYWPHFSVEMEDGEYLKHYRMDLPIFRHALRDIQVQPLILLFAHLCVVSINRPHKSASASATALRAAATSALLVLGSFGGFGTCGRSMDFSSGMGVFASAVRSQCLMM
ncbi:TPA: hypothetical protein ACH3X2_011935 [Trebouxia sp. C0005]